MKVNIPKLIISLVITEGAGGIGSFFTAEAIPTWYASLNRSPLTPPNWLFAPMWITLYFLMGLSLYLVLQHGKEGNDKRLALSLFAVQLILNVLWSVIFFGGKQILFGAVEIVFMWFFILATIIEFRPLNRVASYLLFPYLSWVTVATVLNFSILWVNP